MASTTWTADAGFGNAYVDSLIGGNWKWDAGSGPVTYAFGPTLAWTSAEKAMFRSVFQSYLAVCGLTFAEGDYAVGANLVEWKKSQISPAGNILGQHETPYEGAGSGPTALYGQFSTATPYWSVTPGSFGHATVVHEIGHALNLAHPHDGGWGDHPTIFPGVTDASGSYGEDGLNQRIWTAMSYNSGWTGQPGPVPGNYGASITPMALDVAALQVMYGANTAWHTGDDVYRLPLANGVGTGWSCIWDAGGTDTISNAGSNRACTINLLAATLVGANAGGMVSWSGGVAGGFTIAHGVVIENAVGGGGNDALVGNEANNDLQGGAGNDTLTGGLGDDTLSGGDGADSVNFSAARAAYAIAYVSSVYTVAGPDGTDAVSGAENFSFSDGSFSISTLIDYAPDGSVSISGTATQNQTLTASNTLADMNGMGTIDYQWLRGDRAIVGATAASYVLVQADVGQLISVQASYIDGVHSAESVRSAATRAVVNLNDAPLGHVTISGTPLAGQVLNVMHDLSDADGLGVISYQWQADGVNIAGATASSFALTATQANAAISVTASYIDGAGASESMSSAPTDPVVAGTSFMTNTSYVGSRFSDWVTGTIGNDTMQGLAGADTLNGARGDDLLIAGAGNDLVNGGDGNDVIRQNDVGSSDTISGGAGFDTVDYSRMVISGSRLYSFNSDLYVDLATGRAYKFQYGFKIGTDRLSEVEAIVGTPWKDTISGSARAENLNGGAGNDTLYGGAGDDILYGGDGKDYLFGDAGDDVLFGQAGNDTLCGREGVNVLYGGAGDDYFGDEGGSNAYIFEGNFGHDTLGNWSRPNLYVDDMDVVQFNGISAASLYFQRVGSDLRITVAGKSDSLRIVEWYGAAKDPLGSVHFQIDRFPAGDDALQGSVVDDLVTLIGAAPVSMVSLMAAAH